MPFDRTQRGTCGLLVIGFLGRIRILRHSVMYPDGTQKRNESGRLVNDNKYLFQRIEFDRASCQLLLEHARNILIFER